ncbi:hypothetical protein GWI33_021307 [Rhynchophorus ferrugineus]|uniref:Uncharacterized protein n=1 Tax=Rhynchophorus ferrugineus TaxID=354439 RepID=A0A834HPZ5_RHYFE|nr:hypothetical protein GWI33_021307 [Rhynchophorus ferrugineus]
MAPKLFYNECSPPCRAVLMVAKAIGLELELEEKDHEELKTEEMLQINPQHTIPVLIDSDEDFTIWDSHAIAGYLVEKYGEDNSLYPKDDIKKRALINQRLFFDDGILFERIKAALYPLKLGTSDQVPEDAADGLIEALGFLESFMGDDPWFGGDDISIADLALLASVSTIEVFFPLEEDRFPKLIDWLNRGKELPYFEECNRKGLDATKDLLATS